MAFCPKTAVTFSLFNQGSSRISSSSILPGERSSQKRSMKMAAALYITSRAQEVPHHHNHAQKLLEYAKIHPPRFFWLSLRSKLVSQNLCREKVILLLQASFWLFLFAKENFQAKNNEQNVRKEAHFTFMQHSFIDVKHVAAWMTGTQSEHRYQEQ